MVTFSPSCVKISLQKKTNAGLLMNILTHLKEFLNTDINVFYKSKLKDVRKYYGIGKNEKLWFNGFDKKEIKYINDDLVLTPYTVPIQRMVWVKKCGTRVHIYLWPSFVIKYCPFPTCTIEYILETSIESGTDPFDYFDDPCCLLESSLPIERHARRIFNILGTSKFMITWSRLHQKILSRLPPVTGGAPAGKGLASAKTTWLIIKSLAEGIGLKSPKYGYLSFANFQIPLK